MSKWYRRRRSSRKQGAKIAVVFVFILLFALFSKYWAFCLTIALSIGICVLAAQWRKKTISKAPSSKINSRSPNVARPYRTSPTYSAKKSFMTNCEKAYFDVLQKITYPHYTVQPQINLASIIDKENTNGYRGELFRNVDFGIFDTNYSLLLLIEINDKSHYQKDRIARDKKVNEICAEAGLPLVTFWTHYGINEQYIHDSLATYLPLLKFSTNPMRQSKEEQNINASHKDTIHHMKLNPRPFCMIKSGQKTIELRLFDEKRQRFAEGDKLVFTNSETGEQLTAGIKKMHHFRTFEELYHSLPLMQCGYTADEIENASPADMQQYYSIEQQRKYGVVGIELFPPE